MATDTLSAPTLNETIPASLFAEVEACQRIKHGQAVCGDAFFFQKVPEEERVIAVISDGLGSGIKANLLATMTARMALMFASSNLPLSQYTDIIMDALPVCRVRKIGYATFTIVDAALNGRTRIVEMGNPDYILVRNGDCVPVEKTEVASQKWPDRVMQVSEFVTCPEDRLIIISDGISQAGLGSPQYKLGWRVQGCQDYILDELKKHATVSARQLTQRIVGRAVMAEPNHAAMDDMTCAMIYFRRPRQLLLLSGPPYEDGHDHEVAQRLANFDGRRAICGGTTANIISRELDEPIKTPLRRGGGGLPPVSTMASADLITEGILTLTQVARYLEEAPAGADDEDAAWQLRELLRESDIIHFLIGTRINEAHQDPNLPVDLDIRRNIIKRIARLLTEKYLKQVKIEYV